MAVNLKEIKDKETVPNQVLDYYKSYSQNQELPKFFSGITCITNIGENVCDLQTNRNTNVTIIREPKEKSDEQSLDISRASSTMSNRKLEWDNGADIGYSNCQDVKILQRSLSLPVFPNSDINKIDGCQKISNNSSKSDGSGGDNVKLVIFTCSSSSETQSPLTDYSSPSFPENNLQEVSSSNSCNDNRTSSWNSDSSSLKKISNFSTTLSYLKQKIGFPGAHSTPYLPEQLQTKPIVLSTPVEQHSEMSLEISAKNESVSNSDEKLSKVVSSPKQKDVKKLSNSKTKVVTLCLTKPVTVECKPIPNQLENKVDQTKQSTVGIQTEDISEKKLISVATETCGNLNQSVIYYEHTDTDASNIDIKSNSGLLSSNFNSLNIDPVTNEKSKCVYEIIKDIDKQVQTIHNSNQSGRRIDSTNFQTQCSKNQFLAENEKVLIEDKSTMIPGGYKLSTNNSQVSSDFCIDKIIPSATTNSIGSNQLEKNIHLLQKLIKSKKYDLPTKKRYMKKIIKNISDSKLLEVSSDGSELLFSGDSQLSTKHTINNNRLSVNHELYSPRVNETLSSAKLYHSWKKEKTLSEKLFEEKNSSGDGQYLVNWADKEREYQICWIRNEINHLGQLKNLLEKKITVDSNPKKSTSTSVYKESHKSRESSGDNPEKYVIQTELDVKTSEQVEYSKKFNDGNLLGDVNNCRKSKQISDDIKKVSSNNMSFNASTFCKVCKTSPCICRTECLNNPALIQKYNLITEDRKPVLLRTRCPGCQKLLCDTNCFTKRCNEYVTKSKIQGVSEFLLPIINSECTGLSSSKTKTSPIIENSCSTCGKSSCSCEPEIENIYFLQNVEDLQKTSKTLGPRTRNRIFENCICNKEDSCNCQFVNNLLEHFDIQKIDTNEYALAKDSAYKCMYDHVAVQTEINMCNKHVQTSKYEENKLSQTDELMVHCKCGPSGLQTQDVIKNGNPQTIPIKNKFTQTITTSKYHFESVCTNADKRSKFMKSDYNPEKINRSTYVCVPVKKFSTDMPKNSMKKYTSLKPKSKTNIKMSTVGTCICGFSDKVYGREEFDRRWSHSGNMEAVTTNEISISTNSDGSMKNTCVGCQKEYSLENIVILTNKKEEFHYCLECLKKHPILSSIYNTDLERMLSLLRESKTQSVRVAEEMTKGVLEKHCSCTNPSRLNYTNYCAYCQFKLDKTIKNNNGIAYSLTLKCDSPMKYKNKKKKIKQMEDIILKLPCPYINKKHKDHDNLTKQDANESRMYQQNKNVPTEKAENDIHDQTGLTLQEYLKINRPDFINSAECRRKTIDKFKLDRELMKDQNKLRWLENSISILHHTPTRRHKLFTEKEMKEITKRNYMKLPEITNRLYHYRQQRLRNADKYIVDTFTKKIQGSVLKGKRTFPIAMNIVSMHM